MRIKRAVGRFADDLVVDGQDNFIPGVLDRLHRVGENVSRRRLAAVVDDQRQTVRPSYNKTRAGSAINKVVDPTGTRASPMAHPIDRRYASVLTFTP